MVAKPEDCQAFAEKYGLNFPLLCDTGRSVGLAYRACASTTAQFAKRISYLIGPDAKIVRAYDTVKPSQHPAEVLADLKG